MNQQEAHRAKRDGAVHRLGDDPDARGHRDAVGREQADAHRRSEANKREDPAIKEQEVHECHINGVPGRGNPGGYQHSHENG